MRSVSWLLLGVLTAGAAGCGTEEEEVEFVKGEDVDGDGKADSSVEATVLDFEFDGELVTDWAASARSVIQDQLLYSIGHLNGNRSVGRLDRLVLSDIATTQEGGKTHIRYHARMPVAWGSKTTCPRATTSSCPAT